MKATKKVALVLCSLILAAGLISCKKDSTNLADKGTTPGPVGQPGFNQRKANVTVRMVDAPSPYAFQQVNLDIQSMAGYFVDSDGTAGWVNLDANAGIYNAISLVNGQNALIGDETEVPAGTLTQLSLVLGSNNTVVIDGQSHQLNFSGQQGVVIDVNQALDEGEDLTLMLDFDAAHSIIVQGSGSNQSFTLNPVIHSFTSAQTGIVTGSVLSGQQGVAIIATSGANVYSTYANPGDGHFMLQGMAQGTYTLQIYYPQSSQPITIPNVQINANVSLNLGLLLGGD